MLNTQLFSFNLKTLKNAVLKIPLLHASVKSILSGREQL